MSDRGSLPRRWRRTSIGAETEERKERVGSTAPPIVLSSTKHHGLVPSDDFFRNRTIYSHDLSNYKRVSKNWFAYATNHLAEGSIGLQGEFISACVSPIYTVFSCREGVDPNYLFRVLKSPQLVSQYKLHEQASVDRRGAIRYQDFGKIPLRLPPLVEQRRITEILDTADEAIRSTERLIAKLEQAKQGLLHDLLTRGIDESGRLRDPDSEPDQFINTYLGRQPLGWELRRFGVLADYVNGYGFKAEDWKEAGLPIIRIQNLNGSANFNFYCGPVGPEWLIQPGDLLFAWSGTRESSFGPTIWRGPQGVLNQHIFNVHENDSIVSRDFLHTLLSYNVVRIAASAHGFKDSFVHVKRSELTSVMVAVPPVDEQERILQVTRSEDRLIRIESLKLESLRLLKAGLMDDLLTGRVRVGAGQGASV